MCLSLKGFNIINSLSRSSKAFRWFNKLICLAAEASGCSKPVVLFEASIFKLIIFFRFRQFNDIFLFPLSTDPVVDYPLSKPGYYVPDIDQVP